MRADRPARMPVLFVGHGSPMNAIEDNAFHRGWRATADRLPKPEAILCVSAHWQTLGVRITAAQHPDTIHDFYGFPKVLFDVRYPAPGSPLLAGRVAALLQEFQPQLDVGRGLDHGAWGVLAPMYPGADVPVVQLSLDASQPASFHYALARRFAPLRDQGVLVIGSGNIVHNLGLFSFHRSEPLDWATRFDEKVRQVLLKREHQALIAYESLGADARLAVPTPEHYLPLLYAIALQEEGEPLAFFNSVVTSSISMTSVVIGEVPARPVGPAADARRP